MALKRRNLKAAREKANLSQEDLAEALETTRVTISHWENAVTEPYPHFKRKLEDRFGIDIELLLAITDESEETAEVPLGEERSCSMIRDASLKETKTGEVLPASAVPASPTSPTVTRCVWQLATPMIENYIVSNPSPHFWQIAHTDYSTPDEMIAAIQAAIKDMNMTMGDSITRRDALCELASIPMITLGKTHTLHARRYEEMLRYCAAALEGCWELYRGSDPVGAQHAFDCVCTYVSMLETIAHDASRLRKQALDLAAQFALLQTMLGWGRVKKSEAVDFALNALFLCNETGNISLQLSARTKLNWTYLRGRQYFKSWETMQEGEHVLIHYQRRKSGPTVPPGMIGNFYSGYSMAQIRNGIDPDAALSVAINNEPIKGHIAFVEFTAPEQAWETAWTYCAKGDARQTMIWLEKLIDLKTLDVHSGIAPSESEGAANILTATLLQSQDRDMKHTIRAWKSGMKEAQDLEHERLYDEAMTNFAIMKALWPSERAIRDLMPLTSHW